MTFIVVLIAFLVERFFDWSHLRNWYWLPSIETKLLKRFPNLSPYLIIALAILPLLLAVLLIHYLLADVFYGFGLLIFNVIVLIYCFGPHNLWVDVFSSLNQLSQNDDQLAREKLATVFAVKNTDDLSSLRKGLLNQTFIESYRRVFAIVFWYVVLGIFGVVLYRAIAVSNDETIEINPSLSKASTDLEAILDWVPVRIYTFFFALSGQFLQVLSAWQEYLFKGLSYNKVLLTSCGLAGVDEDKESSPTSDMAEKHAISLIDRAFVISLVIIALGSFIFW